MHVAFFKMRCLVCRPNLQFKDWKNVWKSNPIQNWDVLTCHQHIIQNKKYKMQKRINKIKNQKLW